MNDQDNARVERYGVGLIRLKCKDCGTEYLARLDRYCHEENPPEYHANSYCRTCESKDPLRKMEIRRLNRAVVEKQRIDPNIIKGGGEFR